MPFTWFRQDKTCLLKVRLIWDLVTSLDMVRTRLDKKEVSGRFIRYIQAVGGGFREFFVGRCYAHIKTVARSVCGRLRF